MDQDQRLKLAQSWLKNLQIDLSNDIRMVAGDASFRRYFRIQAEGETRILMDAPPPDDSLGTFIDIDRRLRDANLHAPEIIHKDLDNGFLLLEDLGDDMYRSLLSEHSVDICFAELFDVLKQMALHVNSDDLPDYDVQLLRSEMDLFPDWYLDHHRNGFSRIQFDLVWDDFCHQIFASALDQPQCFVHRDFHSCNLLRTADRGVGIIDFQDAVKGPISYDLISLIWDRYINWPRDLLENWMEAFRQSLDLDISAQKWQRDCDLMGLQRNIKIVGIFARLYYRDGKKGYIEMIPRFYQYITSTLRRYPEFTPMLKIMEQSECAP